MVRVWGSEVVNRGGFEMGIEGLQALFESVDAVLEFKVFDCEFAMLPLQHSEGSVKRIVSNWIGHMMYFWADDSGLSSLSAPRWRC